MARNAPDAEGPAESHRSDRPGLLPGGAFLAPVVPAAWLDEARPRRLDFPESVDACQERDADRPVGQPRGRRDVQGHGIRVPPSAGEQARDLALLLRTQR
jgi:hypothetical protein